MKKKSGCFVLHANNRLVRKNSLISSIYVMYIIYLCNVYYTATSSKSVIYIVSWLVF